MALPSVNRMDSRTSFLVLRLAVVAPSRDLLSSDGAAPANYRMRLARILAG